MSTQRIAAGEFEARYRRDPDPWNYTTSPYERGKYAATLRACGPGPHARVLELGGSIGVFSLALAPRCADLITLDAAPTAVLAARQRLAGHPHADARIGVLPDDLPEGPFDLAVASEILYYLSRQDLDRTIDGVVTRLGNGGRLVAVHWRPRTGERALDADDVHGLLAVQKGLRRELRQEHAEYILERFVRTDG